MIVHEFMSWCDSPHKGAKLGLTDAQKVCLRGLDRPQVVDGVTGSDGEKKQNRHRCHGFRSSATPRALDQKREIGSILCISGPMGLGEEGSAVKSTKME